MIRIAITAAAFDAISATLPFLGYEPELDENGQRLIWIAAPVVDRLRALRVRGEDISDTILRLVEMESRL